MVAVVDLSVFVVLTVLLVDLDLTRPRLFLSTAITSLLVPVVTRFALVDLVTALAVVTLMLITAAAQKDVLHSLIL